LSIGIVYRDHLSHNFSDKTMNHPSI
jgi:hypothetical protein